jgi:hypothetical protein
MTPLLYILWCSTVALLLILVTWASRGTSGEQRRRGILQEPARRNIQYFPQMQQALSPEDREFLLEKGGAELARKVFGERRRIAGEYLQAMNEEFSRLLRMARIIATLSPKVAPMQEFERMRLSVVFYWRLRAIRLRLALGAAPAPDLSAVSDIVSKVSVRMDVAMKELGERAALAAEMASAVDGRDVYLT